jgi:hypothetical protein
MTIAHDILNSVELNSPARFPKLLHNSTTLCTKETIDHVERTVIKYFKDNSALLFTDKEEVNEINIQDVATKLIDYITISPIKIEIKKEVKPEMEYKENYVTKTNFNWTIVNGHTIQIENWRGEEPIHNHIVELIAELRYRFRFAKEPLSKFKIIYKDKNENIHQLIINPDGKDGRFVVIKMVNFGNFFVEGE